MELDAWKILAERDERLTEIDGVRDMKRGDNGAEIGQHLPGGCKGLLDGRMRLLDRAMKSGLKVQAQGGEMMSQEIV